MTAHTGALWSDRRRPEVALMHAGELVDSAARRAARLAVESRRQVTPASSASSAPA
ncbi:MAG: hypothetical protein ABWY90_06045 [Solirubrobacterales bacterium]